MKTALILISMLSLAACQKRIVVPAPAAGTHSVHMTWTASTTPGVSYLVYRKGETCAGGAAFSKITSSPVSGLAYDDLNMADGTYCYQVTSYLASSTPPESAPSNRAEAAINPPNPPTNLTVTPAAVTLNIGEQQQFVAWRGPGAVPASWSINPQEGAIDVAGLYRAPAEIRGNNVKVQVVARESNESATADITIRK